MPSLPDLFVTDVDTAFVQQVLDIPQRERKPNVQHHRQSDDLGQRLEVPEKGALGPSMTPGSSPARIKPSSSKSAGSSDPLLANTG
ncbi:MAG: hypothetical protein AAF667_17745 [Pseudomonadota bacterium]